MNEREQTIRKIEQLHKGRKPLNIAAVKRHSPELIEVAYRQDPYWGWRCALEDAGVDYDTINVEVLDYVVCRICGAELRALGGLHLQHLHNMYPSEYQQEFPGAEMRSEKLRCFHPGTKLIMPHWEPFMTPEYALDRLWAFHRKGLPLNQQYCLNHEPVLVSAIMRYFKGWDGALTKLGLSPKDIRLHTSSEELTPDRITERLRELYSAGQDLSRTAMRTRKDHANLCIYAAKVFGSYQAALEAAGIDAAELLPTARYEREYDAFLVEVRKLRQLVGRPRWEKVVWLRENYWRFVATRFGDSWNQLADELRMPREKVSPYRYPTREDTLCEVRERLKRKASLRQAAWAREDSSLHHAIIEQLGGYTELRKILRAEGIDPDENRRKAEYGKFVAEVTAAAGLSGRERWERVMELRRRYYIFVKTRFNGKWALVAEQLGLPVDKLAYVRYPTRAEALYELDLRARQSKANDQSTLIREDAALHEFVRKSLGGYHRMRRELEAYQLLTGR